MNVEHLWFGSPLARQKPGKRTLLFTGKLRKFKEGFPETNLAFNLFSIIQMTWCYVTLEKKKCCFFIILFSISGTHNAPLRHPKPLPERLIDAARLPDQSRPEPGGWEGAERLRGCEAEGRLEGLEQASLDFNALSR